MRDRPRSRSIPTPGRAAARPMAGALIVTAELAQRGFRVARSTASRALSRRPQPGAGAPHDVSCASAVGRGARSGRALRTLGESQPPRATIDGLMDLGGGVAFRIVSPDLDRIRDELADGLPRLARRAGQRRLAAARHHPEQGRAEGRRALLIAALEADFAPRPLGDQRPWPAPLSRRPVGDASRFYPFRGR